jgi:Protein of Unknown function (DUF2784)
MYGILADAVVCVHVLYVAYVLFGQLAIVVAAPFNWRWARNPWFRFTHLVCIGIVAVEALMKWPCPLTVWEHQLRELAGQRFNESDTFMGRLMHHMLFIDGLPEVAFTVAYVASFLIVLQGVVMYPPRWFRLARRPAGLPLTPAPV